MWVTITNDNREVCERWYLGPDIEIKPKDIKNHLDKIFVLAMDEDDYSFLTP
uniref:Uncharacterized protein n=1 Tax=viral metagenome TaxID=1070528 RepID=A0A6M3LPU6_9ZZZZ